MLLYLFLLALGAFAFFHYRKHQRAQRVEWLSGLAARKREEREESLEWARGEAASLPASEREAIAKMDFEQLKESLASGSVSVSSAVKAYYSLALAAHEETNCLTVFIKESLHDAEELDKKAADPTWKKPAFFGIPISIKECVSMKGYDQTRGYAESCFQPSKKDSLLIQQLRLLGMVPFVQTNVPMSLLTYTCGNEIYGWTENPHKKGRTPGGSSGGEAALIAAKGSIIGIGGDVGGSIRTPAHFTGTAGFKPSHNRLSSLGVVGSVPGRPMINASDGPMAPSIHSCTSLLKEIWGSAWIADRDPYVPPLIWREKLADKEAKYKIGYFTDDGWFKPTAGCERVIYDAKRMLEAKGHTLVPFSPPDVSEAYRLFVSCVCVDGGAFLIGKIENDLPPAIFLSALMPLRLPLLVQRLGGKIAGLLGYSRVRRMGHAMALSTAELRRNYAAIEKYREHFLEAMQSAGVDMLLCPPSVMPAPPHEAPLHLSAAVSYTALFNMLDYGAGVVRAGTWTPEDEANLSEYPTTDTWYTMVKKFSQDSVGLPLGAQIAAPPYREEAALKVLGDLEDAYEESVKGARR